MIHVPEFCFMECTNMLWKRVRFHDLAEPVAEGLLNNLLALPITVVPSAGVLKRGLQIGLKRQLAETLTSDDQRQAQAAQAEDIVLKPITDFGL